MTALSNIGLLTAFGAGIVSFLSPCVLPLVPGYISYVAGKSVDAVAEGDSRHRPFHGLALSGCFVLGFTTVFVIFGASATALGQLLLKYRYEENLAGGGIVVLFGLAATGLVGIPWLERDIRWHPSLRGGRPFGAYVLGVGFAFGWTPCIGPVLGSILTMSAVSASVSSGVILLTVYSLGLGVPFLASAAFTNGLLQRMRTIRPVGRALQLGTGAVMILMGVAMITGELNVLSYWLLQTFPVLAQIG